MDENKDEMVDKSLDNKIENNEVTEDYKEVKKEKNKMIAFFLDWVVPVIAAIIIAVLIKQFLIFKVYIPSGSMIPTLNEGDQLFVTRVYNLDNLERGDIVVFNSEELEDVLIKRLIGLPGDKIEINNGTVSVNGEELEEDYVKNNDNYNGEFEVPEGKYFFLGDNRAISYDSRKWKDHYIDGSEIKAKAQIRVYPFSDFGFIE